MTTQTPATAEIEKWLRVRKKNAEFFRVDSGSTATLVRRGSRGFNR